MELNLVTYFGTQILKNFVISITSIFLNYLPQMYQFQCYLKIDIVRKTFNLQAVTLWIIIDVAVMLIILCDLREYLQKQSHVCVP